MGSLGLESEDHISSSDQKEWNVLVTGFGPFFDNAINPSYPIARSLPSSLKLPSLPHINIHVYPEPIEVAYRHVRTLIPELLTSVDDNGILQPPRPHKIQISEGGSRVGGEAYNMPPHGLKPIQYDLTLNIGLAPGRRYYSMETIAHRDGYAKRDIHHEDMLNDTFWHDAFNAPETLQPAFDTTTLWTRWKEACGPNEDVRPSVNAGRFLCEYILYASMLECYKRSIPQRCLFVHVPIGSDEKDVQRGAGVVLALIEAAVACAIAEEGMSIRVQAPDERSSMGRINHHVMNEGDGT